MTAVYKTKFNKWYALYIMVNTQDEQEFYRAYKYITECRRGMKNKHRLWNEVK